MSLPVQTNLRVLETSAYDGRVMTMTDSATMKTYHFKPRDQALGLSFLDMANARLVSPDGHIIPKEDYHLYAYRKPSSSTIDK